MKSKVVILSLLLTGAAISASAQTKESSIPKGLRTISLSVWVPEHKDV